MSISSKKPLVVFVHIPKTAGSTMNEALTKWSNNGRSHCEGIGHDHELVLQTMSSSDWISGHLDLNYWTKLTQKLDRDVKFITLFRDPIAQLASHYNWLIEIFYKGNTFYNGHPEIIKNISLKIRNSDITSAYNISSILDQYPNLFRNVQSKYCSINQKTTDLPVAIKHALSRFSSFGFGNEIARVFEDATGVPFPEINRINKSNYHFDKKLFYTKEMDQFLSNYNNIDHALLSCARYKLTVSGV